jgi:hypothetical protein
MADSAHASGQSARPITLPQALLEIAEHLKDTGDFNEQAYISLCDAAKQTNDIRDIVVENLIREVDEAKETKKQASEEFADAGRLYRKANAEMTEANAAYEASMRRYQEATEIVQQAAHKYAITTADIQRATTALDQIKLLIGKYKNVKGLGKAMSAIVRKHRPVDVEPSMKRRSLRLALK